VRLSSSAAAAVKTASAADECYIKHLWVLDGIRKALSCLRFSSPASSAAEAAVETAAAAPDDSGRKLQWVSDCIRKAPSCLRLSSPAAAAVMTAAAAAEDDCDRKL
jgi:hypothetical protein